MKRKPLTSQQREFMRLVIAGSSQTRAYIEAYKPEPNVIDGVLRRRASELAIRLRPYFDEVRDGALAQLTMQAADVLREWVAIATADPNEIVRHRRVNCRRCRGVAGAHQWIDVAEWAAAAEIALREKRQPPSDEGGYGFDFTLPPDPYCIACRGEGVGEVFFADTGKLAGKAKRLYGGVRITPRGTEIIMRNQDAALTNIAKYLGMLEAKQASEEAEGGSLHVKIIRAVKPAA